MTFDARERSTYGGQPFEMYAWTLGTTVWRQASGDISRTYLGNLYTPATLLRTEVDQNGESASGNITVTLDLDNPVAKLFQPLPPSQPLSLYVICSHDGESEAACVFTGRVLSAKFGEVCEFTCAPRQTVWRQPVPGLAYQCQCPLRVFSPRCGVDRILWRVMATVTGVAGLTITSAAFATKPDGHFNGGWVEANGEIGMITAHAGGVFTLQAPVPGLAAGDVVAAFPGCQGTEADCHGRYNNLPNHLGFKRIPTRQPFDSGGI